MALTAYGFTGTVDEVAWADIATVAGSSYAVGGQSDFAAQSVIGQDRTVRVLPGSAWGHGVLVESDANENVQLDTVSSGTRWDTVVLRRTWGTGSVSVTKVNGTSAQQVASGVNDNPGVVDDQPLALVQVTAGQTLPTAILDLRWQVGPNIWLPASSPAPPVILGAQFRRGSSTFHGEVVSGSPTWVEVPDQPNGKETLTAELGSGVTTGTGSFELRSQRALPGGVIVVSGRLNVNISIPANQILGRVAQDHRSTAENFCNLQELTSNVIRFGYIASDGRIYSRQAIPSGAQLLVNAVYPL